MAQSSRSGIKEPPAVPDGGWGNWSGSVVCEPKSIARPASEEELSQIVAKATAESAQIRGAGTGHSFSPICATEGYLVSLDALQGIVAINEDTRQARVRAGTKLHRLGAPLLEAGLALENQGDIDRQSIAGAISTGTHGTGVTLQNLSAQVAALKLITASGETLECAPDKEPELFRAALVSLGALGILSEVTLQCVPAYKLHERNWSVPFDEAMARLDAMIAEHRHFEFFYSKRDDECILKTLTPTDAPRAMEMADGERIGWSHEVFPTDRNFKFNEMEYSVPLESGPDCMHEIRGVLLKHDEVGWPIEYRTVRGDDIPLSPHYGRHSVTISLHQSYRREHEAYFRDCEAVFRTHGGRPHWGKMQYQTHAEIAGLYPEWDVFQRARERLDPNRVFGNSYLERVLG